MFSSLPLQIATLYLAMRRHKGIPLSIVQMGSVSSLDLQEHKSCQKAVPANSCMGLILMKKKSKKLMTPLTNKTNSKLKYSSTKRMVSRLYCISYNRIGYFARNDKFLCFPVSIPNRASVVSFLAAVNTTSF